MRTDNGSAPMENELWEFDESGLMRRREASINDVAIADSDRKFHWPALEALPSFGPEIHAIL